MGTIEKVYYGSFDACSKELLEEIRGRLTMLAGVLMGDRFNLTRDILMEHKIGCNESPNAMAMRVEDFLLSSADSIGTTMIAARVTFTQESEYIQASGEIFEENIYAFVKEIGK